MKKNMSFFDSVIRIVLAVLVAILYFTKVIDGTTAIIAGTVAIVLVLTSFMRFCPLYFPFGINTNKKKGS